MRAIAQERVGLSEIGQFRREFWAYHAERYRKTASAPAMREATPGTGWKG